MLCTTPRKPEFVRYPSATGNTNTPSTRPRAKSLCFGQDFLTELRVQEAEVNPLQRLMILGMAEGDARFAEVVWGYLDLDAITDADADEVLAHFAGNMREDFVPVRQGNAKHCARQHLGHRALQRDRLFFCHF